MTTHTKDALSATASSLRAVMSYVSASDERTDPNSVINQARADEPVFVLRARDMVATATIEWWLWCARNRGVPAEKLERAERQRRAADLWIEKRLPTVTGTDGHTIIRTARMEREDADSVLNASHPDEPVFVIVASDAVSTEVVEYWAFMAERHGAPRKKVEGAMEVAKAMARWQEKRIVGTGARRSVSDTKPVLTEVPRPRHKTVMHLVCLECGHDERLGEPPFDEELLATVRETCEGPCPTCGAAPVTDPDTGRIQRVLTTTMSTAE